MGINNNKEDCDENLHNASLTYQVSKQSTVLHELTPFEMLLKN
jgi:hypothetical protein